MTIDYIKKKKLCPFMSDSQGKVYCTPECGFASEHYWENEPEKLLGITCGLYDGIDKLDIISEKLELISGE